MPAAEVRAYRQRLPVKSFLVFLPVSPGNTDVDGQSAQPVSAQSMPERPALMANKRLPAWLHAPNPECAACAGHARGGKDGGSLTRVAALPINEHLRYSCTLAGQGCMPPSLATQQDLT